jgi:hypothetical protein
VWDEFGKAARESDYRPEKRVGPDGRITYLPGDARWYATSKNIPTSKLGAIAQRRLDAISSAGGEVPGRYYNVDYGRLFRESTSGVMGFLADRGGRLGDVLAATYGKVTTNAAVTTLYYVARFATDIRYHAMNWAESQILYMGRAALRPGEIRSGMFGQTEAYMRRIGADATADLGYAAGRSRAKYAYKTFLKEQPEALRKALRGLDAENPALMDDALREIAVRDPELAATIGEFSNGNVNAWLKEMNRYYEERLGQMAPESATDAAGNLTEAPRTFDEAILREMAADPALAQVYSRIQLVNDQLWSDVRHTFFGNAERSRVERVLNHYLLFWPLSYQIKAGKWLIRVLFDRAGGLPTNAAGAYELSHLAQEHQRMLAADPEYGDWFEKHPTLVFAAGMLLPITWDSMGVSLNPILRSVFFGRSKSGFDIGPVWTYRHIVQPGAGELYPDLKDVPGIDAIYRGVAGRETTYGTEMQRLEQRSQPYVPPSPTDARDAANRAALEAERRRAAAEDRRRAQRDFLAAHPPPNP